MKVSTTSKRLKEIIHEKNIKQVDILKKAQLYCDLYGIKLTKADLSQYVSGKVEPGQEKLFILSQTLDVDAAWLMGYDVQKNRTEASTKRILTYFNMLNTKGQEEAEKRVFELTQLGIYVETQNTDAVIKSITECQEAYNNIPVAAHNDHFEKPGQLDKMQRDLGKLKKPE